MRRIALSLPEVIEKSWYGTPGYRVKDKGFLRLRIAEDGRLTVFPIGVKRVPRRWTPSPEVARKLGPLDRPEDFQPRLIDGPIHVVPASRMSPRRAGRADRGL